MLSVLVLIIMATAAGRAQTLWQQLRSNEVSQKASSVIEETVFVPGPYCIENRLNKVLDSLAAFNLKATRIQGFRILLYSGNQRSEATKAKEKAYRLLPNSNVYTSYQQPTFKVKLGDFYEKREAFLQLGKLESGFPNAVIVEELVSLK